MNKNSLYILLLLTTNIFSKNGWYNLPIFQPTYSYAHVQSYVDTWSSSMAYSIIEDEIKIEQQINDSIIPVFNTLSEELERYELTNSYYQIYKEGENVISSFFHNLSKIEPGNLSLSDQVEHLMWFDACTAQASLELQQALNNTLSQMSYLLIDEQGHVRSELNFFEKHGWNSYSKLVDRYENQVKDWYQVAGQINCAQSVLHDYQRGYKSPISMGTSAIYARGDLKDYKELKILCNNEQFEQAYKIVQKHEGRFAKNPQDNFFQKVYVYQFCQKFDWRGIDKRYLNDPIIETLNLTARATPSHYNEMLKERYDAKQEFLKACNVTNPSSQFEALVYDILDDYTNHNYQGMFDKASQVLNSSPELYSKLVDYRNGTFKFLKLNTEISNVQFTSSIHRADNTDLRTIVNRLGLIDTSASVAKSQVMQALEYVKHALHNADGASRYFANRITDSLEKGIDDPVLHLPDLCSKLSCQDDDILRGKVSGYIADKLRNYDQCSDIYIQKMVQAYQGMISGDSNMRILLEKTFGQEVQENVLLIDIEQLKAKVIEVNEDFNTIFDRLAVAYRDVAANGLVRDEIYTQTDAATRLCLLERGINPLIYERFSGDQIQQVWHQLDVKALQVGGHLSLQAIPIGAKQILEFGLQSNFAVNAFIRAKAFGNAFNSTCSALISYNYVAGISRICDAADLGLKTAENTLIHMAKDPVGAAISFGKGLVHLALMVDNQARKFAEISHNAIFNPEKAKAQLHEHKAEIKALTNEIIKTIEQKGIEGCVQDLTQFAAESIVLGAASRAVKAASFIAAKKIGPLLNLAKNEVVVAETTAGTLENLGKKSAPEICALSESGQLIKQPFKICEKIPDVFENNVVNQSSTAILKNGYYEVNGFKMTEYYYKHLWSNGRQAPSVVAQEILNTAIDCIPDLKKPGFFRYEALGWEMIYDPITKEIWHLQPITKK